MLGDRFEWSLMCTLFLCVFVGAGLGAVFLASAHRKESRCHTSGVLSK